MAPSPWCPAHGIQPWCPASLLPLRRFGSGTEQGLGGQDSSAWHHLAPCGARWNSGVKERDMRGTRRGGLVAGRRSGTRGGTDGPARPRGHCHRFSHLLLLSPCVTCLLCVFSSAVTPKSR